MKNEAAAEAETAYPSHKDYVEKVRAKHNDICISTMSLELGRIIGIHFDSMDVYHIISYPQGNGNEPKIEYESMVGGCDSLKGIYPNHDWLSETFAYQGAPPTDEFLVSADTREQFESQARSGKQGPIIDERVAHALAEYDECVAPLLNKAA